MSPFVKSFEEQELRTIYYMSGVTSLNEYLAVTAAVVSDLFVHASMIPYGLYKSEND